LKTQLPRRAIGQIIHRPGSLDDKLAGVLCYIIVSIERPGYGGDGEVEFFGYITNGWTHRSPKRFGRLLHFTIE